jgi:hypothetical protein
MAVAFELCRYSQRWTTVQKVSGSSTSRITMDLCVSLPLHKLPWLGHCRFLPVCCHFTCRPTLRRSIFWLLTASWINPEKRKELSQDVSLSMFTGYELDDLGSILSSILLPLESVRLRVPPSLLLVGKAAGAWSWLLTSIRCRCYYSVTIWKS